MPDTFGGMALSILKKACSNSQIVLIAGLILRTLNTTHAVLQKHLSKSVGRLKKEHLILAQHGAHPNSKKDFLIFLRDEWNTETYASTLKGHQVYFAVGQECYIYTEER